MSMASEASVGYLVWRLSTKWRAAVDRAVAPFGLTHAQYSLLASLYGMSQAGRRPSQRELAEHTGLEPVFVSKLARALEGSGLLQRAEHPADTRAVQLTLTERGAQVAVEAIAAVQALLDNLTKSLGGTRGKRTRELAETLRTLLEDDNP
ncbi:MAG: MarR family transcriptional regulator [Micromonosporaceae bacterium]|jgi:DNA-binding MarR family transcriptional regulator|nr:MarR family transcriptional regulator [Micromonosporaceae bacterium]